jgi:hypothetical protein
MKRRDEIERKRKEEILIRLVREWRRNKLEHRMSQRKLTMEGMSLVLASPPPPKPALQRSRL